MTKICLIGHVRRTPDGLDFCADLVQSVQQADNGAMEVAFVVLHAQPDDSILPLAGWRFLTAWTWVTWAALPLLVGTLLYGWGVLRLHRRGDRWPWWRSAFFALGSAVIAVAVMGFLGVYDNVLFWVHMVQHMLFTMIAPVFFALSAPVTLALRALPARGRRGLTRVLHSRLAKLLTFPPLATVALIATPFALYTTELYNFTLNNDWAHDLLHVWMVVAGGLFFVTILAVDPVPVRLPYPVRMLLLLVSMPGHVFLGTMIMGTQRLIAEEWYVAFLREWGPSPQSDQYWAGALLWATGDLTMAVTMGALAVLWWRDSQREARRVDRALDREELRAAASAGSRHPSPHD